MVITIQTVFNFCLTTYGKTRSPQAINKAPSNSRTTTATMTRDTGIIDINCASHHCCQCVESQTSTQLCFNAQMQVSTYIYRTPRMTEKLFTMHYALWLSAKQIHFQYWCSKDITKYFFSNKVIIRWTSRHASVYIKDNGMGFFMD